MQVKQKLQTSKDELINLFNNQQYEHAELKCLNLVKAYPLDIDYLNILGAIYSTMGSLEKAINYYQKALKINPFNEALLTNIAEAFNKLARFDEAKNSCLKALQINGKSENAYTNLGLSYLGEGLLDKAISCFNKSIILKPQNKNAYLNLAGALVKKKSYIESIPIFEKLIIFFPSNLSILNNYAFSLIKSECYNEALKILDNSIKINPNFSETFSLVSDAYYNLGKLDISIAYLQKAISFDSKNDELFNRLGKLYGEERDFKNALSAFENSSSLNPENHLAKYNQSLIHLRLGNFYTGWALYEQGIIKNTREIHPHFFNEKKEFWDGNKFDGYLMIYNEQGLGDQLLFCTLLSDLLKLHKKIIVRIDYRLINLLSRTYKSIKFISIEEYFNEEYYHKYTAMGSLPKILRNSLKEFSNNSFQHYKSCNIADQKFKKSFFNSHKLKIGISWKSFSKLTGSLRSLKRTNVAELLDTNHTFINLQYGEINDEINAINKLSKNNLISIDDVNIKEDIDSVCSIISNCDLVISIDSVLAHIAAGMGKKVFLLNRLYTETPWWMENTKKSIWYPNLIILTQNIKDEWNTVINELKVELEKINQH